jgi:hypothetical protein
LGVKGGRTVRKADKLTASCEPIFYKTWEPRRLTILRSSTACNRDRFTLPYLYQWKVKSVYWIIEPRKTVEDIQPPHARSKLLFVPDEGVHTVFQKHRVVSELH